MWFTIPSTLREPDLQILAVVALLLVEQQLPKAVLES